MLLKVNTSTLEVIQAGVPAELHGLSPESLADLSWAAPQAGFTGVAWWPVVDSAIPVPANNRVVGATYTANAATRQITASPVFEPIPQAELDVQAQAAFTAVVVAFDTALTAHLDTVAKQKRYENRITCMVRAGFAGPFQSEAVAFATWCDTCNITAYQMLAEVQAGTTPMPASPEAFITTLPAMVWPV